MKLLYSAKDSIFFINQKNFYPKLNVLNKPQSPLSSKYKNLFRWRPMNNTKTKVLGVGNAY
jgi:hypothetical protein